MLSLSCFITLLLLISGFLFATGAKEKVPSRVESPKPPPPASFTPAPVPRQVAPPPRPSPVDSDVIRPGGGGPVDKAKVAQFKKSLNTWEELKVECGGNYTYSKRWSSWVGFGHTTEVEVENNKVVERPVREMVRE